MKYKKRRKKIRKEKKRILESCLHDEQYSNLFIYIKHIKIGEKAVTEFCVQRLYGGSTHYTVKKLTALFAISLLHHHAANMTSGYTAHCLRMGYDRQPLKRNTSLLTLLRYATLIYF